MHFQIFFKCHIFIQQFEEWENKAQESDNLDYTWLRKTKPSSKKVSSEVDESNTDKNQIIDKSPNELYSKIRIKILSEENVKNIALYKEAAKKMLKLNQIDKGNGRSFVQCTFFYQII